MKKVKKRGTTAKMADHRSTMDDLKNMMRDFVEQRQWWSYHTPKNLAISINLEASELLEHFQWTPTEEKKYGSEKMREIEEEMSDILAYLLSMANVLKIDLATAFEKKMEKNARKYPVERFQGNWEKMSEPGPRITLPRPRVEKPIPDPSPRATGKAPGVLKRLKRPARKR